MDAAPLNALKAKHAVVQQSYKAAMFNPALYQLVISRITPGSAPGEGSKLTRLDTFHFAHVLQSVERQFFDFALSQPDFRSLPQPDRATLISNAASLFVHLLVGKTFVAKTGYQQLGCLVGSTLSDADQPRNLSRLSFREFSATSGFFSAGQEERETRYMLLILLRLPLTRLQVQKKIQAQCLKRETPDRQSSNVSQLRRRRRRNLRRLKYLRGLPHESLGSPNINNNSRSIKPRHQ